MQYVLWTLASFIAYTAGLIVIMRITPLLLPRSFDEPWFMGIAVIDIVGAILAFGGVIVTYSLFSGAFAVKVLDFFLLVGILFAAARTSLVCFRPRTATGTFQVSRIMAGSYGLFLAAAACYYIVEIFISR